MRGGRSGYGGGDDYRSAIRIGSAASGALPISSARFLFLLVTDGQETICSLPIYQSIEVGTVMSLFNFHFHRFLAACVLAGSVALAQAATIYTTTNNGTSLGTVDSLTGVGTVVGPFGQSNCFSLAFDTNGTMYVTCGGNLYTGNKTTGALTLVGSTAGINYGMEFDASGQLWGINGNNLYKIDKTNGATTLVGSTGAASNVMDISFGVGGTLYVVDGAARLFTVNTTTGAATLVGTMGSSIMALMSDTSGAMYAISYATPGVLYRVNTGTAALTPIGGNTGLSQPHGGSFGAFFGAASTAPTSIPTLSEWALIGLSSLVAMFGIARIRRRQA